MKQSEKNDDDRHENKVGIRSTWVVIAEAENRMLAEFAVNGLRSYDIPAVLDARPGILGTAGLQMRSLRTGELEKFKILVPPEYEEEAAEVVKLFLGGDREKIDENGEG